MIVIRWAAFAVFLICMAVAADDVRHWLLAGIALAAFLVFAWTLRGTDHPRGRRLVLLTRDEYDALESRDPHTYYLIEEASAGGHSPSDRAPSTEPPAVSPRT